ncbi:MAG TPA: hypothetical protein VNB06_00765 [Thermoanaerobaculia bacterium]|nr:hypothetical protein [Thermoanaerobaculia bacterium]
MRKKSFGCVFLREEAPVRHLLRASEGPTARDNGEGQWASSMTNRDDRSAWVGAGESQARDAAAPEIVALDARLTAVWDAMEDPVQPARPGEDAARVARVLAAYREELARRERYGALSPLPLRWAAVLAPAVGLVLGLVATSALDLDAAATAPAPLLAEALESPTTWSGLTPPLLAELYLGDLGLGPNDDTEAEVSLDEVLR